MGTVEEERRKQKEIAEKNKKNAGKGYNLAFGEMNVSNIGQLRKLNTSVLPVRYQEKFYTDVLNTPEDFSKFAYLNSLVVGAISSRIEDKEEGVVVSNDIKSSKKVYILTLAVLAAYRGEGIGSQLVESVIEACRKQPNIEDIYLHVQTSNDDAIRFYDRLGFKIEGKIEKYYKRINPPDCYILKKDLTIPDPFKVAEE